MYEVRHDLPVSRSSLDGSAAQKGCSRAPPFARAAVLLRFDYVRMQIRQILSALSLLPYSTVDRVEIMVEI